MPPRLHADDPDRVRPRCAAGRRARLPLPGRQGASSAPHAREWAERVVSGELPLPSLARAGRGRGAASLIHGVSSWRLLTAPRRRAGTLPRARGEDQAADRAPARPLRRSPPAAGLGWRRGQLLERAPALNGELRVRGRRRGRGAPLRRLGRRIVSQHFRDLGRHPGPQASFVGRENHMEGLRGAGELLVLVQQVDA